MKIIKFYANRLKRSFGVPVPTKKTLPDWYKESESFYYDASGKKSNGLKKCMPYTDAMVSGYVLTLPVDIHVSKNEDGSLKINWDGPQQFADFIGERPKELGEKMPRPYGFAPNHLVFSGFWAFKTPRGWSSLVTHPFNRVDLPFHTVTAIMDSDAYASFGNIPFFMRDDFEGIIPAGTPFAQIIPIKRASWKMIIDPGMEDWAERQAIIVRNESTPYKKIAWYRKKFD